MSKILAQQANATRLAELERCRTDLFYLATEYLNYGWNPKAGRGKFPGKGLTKRLHQPICKWWDRYRDDHFMGLWIPRWHHKTTLVIAGIIQDILIDPNTYMFYFHAVDELAADVVNEVGTHLQKNKKLRKLDPVGIYPDGAHKDLAGRPYNIFPAPNASRFLKTQEFETKRGLYVRFPTLLGKGAGSEVTGAHAAKAWIDDMIGKRAIEDNLIPKLTRWYQNTVLPVVDDVQVRVTGTKWTDWGPYEDWQKDPDWRTCTMSAANVEELKDIDWTQQHIKLTPDYKLENPIAGPTPRNKKQIAKLKLLQRQMKSDFAPQMMNDASPQGDKPWNKSSCEHFIGIRAQDGLPGAAGPGSIFVLSDPAPVYVGSRDETKQKARGDGTKDKWAIAVVKVRVRNQLKEHILIDGSCSRKWTTDDGMDEACRLMKKYKTRFCIHEAYGGLSQNYDKEMHRASVRNGVKWKRYDSKGKPIQFKNSYASGSKNKRFADLAAMAELEEFYICAETIPHEFLYGEEGERHDGFLPQARDWRPLDGGRNSLSYDDCADVVARLTDPVVEEYSSHVLVAHEPKDEWITSDSSDRPENGSRFRYVRG